MAIKSKKIKLDKRTKVKFKIRRRVSGTDERPRLSVFKSVSHSYAQLISDQTGRTLLSASTLDKEVLEVAKTLKLERPAGDTEGAAAESAPRSRSAKSVAAARAVGIVLAKRGKDQKVSKVVFDRNGFLYHGRIKAIADGAREGGLDF